MRGLLRLFSGTLPFFGMLAPDLLKMPLGAGDILPRLCPGIWQTMYRIADRALCLILYIAGGILGGGTAARLTGFLGALLSPHHCIFHT